MTNAQHTSFYAMGTRCYIVFPNLEEDEADVLFRHVREEISRIEGQLSRFLPQSDISKINSRAAKEPVTINKELFRVLKACQMYYGKTDGFFDVTLRPVLQYWKDFPDGSREQVAEILDRIGMKRIHLDEKKRTVTFENEDIEIDLGGFGKGYALEKVNDMLLRYGVDSGFLTMGESSVLTLGNHPAGDHWKVGIKNYLKPEESIHTYSIRYGSVSTSSNFFVDDDGKLVNHRHVIHPVEGIPVEETVTATAFSQSALMAEVLSTALLVMPEEKIPEVLKAFPDVTLLKVSYTDDGIEKRVWPSEKKQDSTESPK